MSVSMVFALLDGWRGRAATRRGSWAGCAVVAVLWACSPWAHGEETVALLVQSDMTAAGPDRVEASGPGVGFGTLHRSQASTDDETGQVVAVGGEAAVTFESPLIRRVSVDFSLMLKIRIDRFPSVKRAWIAGQGSNTGWQFGIGHDQKVMFHGSWGGGWYEGAWRGRVPQGKWVHLALVAERGVGVRMYLDGERINEARYEHGIVPTNDSLFVGRGDWRGAVSDVGFYAGVLSDEEVAAAARGEPVASRMASEADVPTPTYPVRMTLARFDEPLGFRDGYGQTRHPAERLPGPHAVDWPKMTLTTNRGEFALFADRSRHFVSVPLEGFEGRRNMPLYQQSYDNRLSLGGHWFRALAWRWNQFYVYTTNRTARSWHGDYELWTFPIEIRGEGENEIRRVQLHVDDELIYDREEALDSLTLLLPASEPGKPYVLTVNGRAELPLVVGLDAIELGSPTDRQVKIDAIVPGEGSTIRVRTPEPPTRHIQQAWSEDERAMRGAVLTRRGEPNPPGLAMFGGLGIETRRSPMTVFAAALPHGMSGGGGYFYRNQHQRADPWPDADAYALHLSESAYDAVFELANTSNDPTDAQSVEAWLNALSRHGVRGGLVPGAGWGRPFLGHPNLGFFGHTLADYHAPLYRDLQLVTQRVAHFDNFAGVIFGADNAGYVSFWDWAPPIPNRPWGEAYAILTGQSSPGLPDPKTWSARRMLDSYIRPYDKTYRSYGYFARAVTDIDPTLVCSTGSFGSSPGVGATGGWPWASIPGEPIFADMPVQTAYDWNEKTSSKPLHNVALIDRLKSYHPNKPTWSIVDNFARHFGKTTRQRTWALVLTRGVQGIGHTFLDRPGMSRSRADTSADQAELNNWVRRLGGVFAHTRPKAQIGILYVHEQSLLRKRPANDQSLDELIDHGPHEGKTHEAMVLCHAAGFSARIVTPAELRRGIDDDIEILLLTGLNRVDQTWVWYEGLEVKLSHFVANGGRVITDHESVSPVHAINTGMRIAAYMNQSAHDRTEELIERNTENITAIQRVLAGVPRGPMTSDDPYVWAVPTMVDDVLYVTVVQQRLETTGNDTNNPSTTGGRLVQAIPGSEMRTQPAIVPVNWSTTRPIYDVRHARRVQVPEVSNVDLTKYAFAFFALPPRPVSSPTVNFEKTNDGYLAHVTVDSDAPIHGIPVTVALNTSENEQATVYGVTGRPISLPIHGQKDGDVTITVYEQLSGLHTTAHLSVSAGTSASPDNSVGVQANQIHAIKSFHKRSVPLVVALTSAQQNDPEIAELANTLVTKYRQLGRDVRLGHADPEDVVTSLQPLKPIQHAPRWQTTESDLILLGTPQSNVLIFDQATGRLLPDSPDEASIAYTWSPFVGDCHAINLVSSTKNGLRHAAQKLISLSENQ